MRFRRLLCVKMNVNKYPGSDGALLDENRNFLLLEIKCPISCKDKKIDVKYIVNGSLKVNDPYYTQCQLQMFCTNAKKTHLFVYSAMDYKIVEVDYDEDFV